LAYLKITQKAQNVSAFSEIFQRLTRCMSGDAPQQERVSRGLVGRLLGGLRGLSAWLVADSGAGLRSMAAKNHHFRGNFAFEIGVN
jgi:hypothetical protein